MVVLLIGLAGQVAIAASNPIHPPVDPSFNPSANQLFDRDPVVKAWAVRRFDTNHDGWLTSYEAQPALAAFKDLADGNRDGSVFQADCHGRSNFHVAGQLYEPRCGGFSRRGAAWRNAGNPRVRRIGTDLARYCSVAMAARHLKLPLLPRNQNQGCTA